MEVCLWYFRLQTSAARSLVKGMRYEVNCVIFSATVIIMQNVTQTQMIASEMVGDFFSAVLEGGVAADKSICCHRAAVAMHTKWPAAGYSTL
jgi:hypothetical protein